MNEQIAISPAEAADKIKPPLVSPQQALATLSLQRALGSATVTALRRGKPVAVSITVPDEDWLEPVEMSINDLNRRVVVVTFNLDDRPHARGVGQQAPI
jgi:hypothetical protein